MCGIIGYTGDKDVSPILIDGLYALEYRGYDSAGVSLQGENETVIVKSKGKIQVLEEKVKERNFFAKCGIGHTRWATHGVPSDVNSHPHTTENLSLVHNGIIENYADLSAMLKACGYNFASETDTEIAACLIDFMFKKTNDPKKAIFEATKLIRGSYAFGIVFNCDRGTVYAIRKDSPLICAHTGTDGVIASDITAILPHSRKFYRLDENVMAVIKPSEIKFYNSNMEQVSQKEDEVNWNVEQAQKGGYKHFMMKEIHEEPEALEKTISAHMKDNLPFFDIETIDKIKSNEIKSIKVVACGSAMHVGLIGRTIIEKLAKIPVSVEIASEFRYRDPIIGKGDMVILISQSGETADTIAALRHAKEKGAYTLAVVNVMGSTVAREADGVIYTMAGPEIAVATTKAYTVQCSIMYLLAIRLALGNGKMEENEAKSLCNYLLKEVPNKVKEAISNDSHIKEIAKKICYKDDLFFIGRKIDWDLCAEGSLKLKEISYIHSEAYATGELKHGTISLIADGTPVIALTTVDDVCEKTISGMREVKARGAYLISVTLPSLAEKYTHPYDEQIIVPQTEELFAPFPTVSVLQLLSYYVSEMKGLDVDKPRNLAKSVTVE